jgi:hypothetical protein
MLYRLAGYRFLQGLVGFHRDLRQSVELVIIDSPEICNCGVYESRLLWKRFDTVISLLIVWRARGVTL